MIVSYPAKREGMILCVDNLLDSQICSQLISKLKPTYDQHAENGKTVSGEMTFTKRSKDLGLNKSPFAKAGLDWDEEYQQIENAIFESFHAAVAFYQDIYPHTRIWENVTDTGYQIQRYDRFEGFYREHVDSFPSANPEMGCRVLAGIVYLNDVVNGGVTNFPMHGAVIQPFAGRIVLFPATFTHPHEATTPLSTDKWIVTTFFMNAPQPVHAHLTQQFDSPVEQYH